MSLREFSAFARGAQPILKLEDAPVADVAADEDAYEEPATMTEADVGVMIHAEYSRATLHVGKDRIPDQLNKVHLVMWYLAQLVGENTLVAKEKRRKYFNPAKVNYFQCFNALDIDESGSITKIEWIDILRDKLLIDPEKINNADLKLMFDIIDADDSGDITVKEFSAFLRGASSSVQARGMAEVVAVKKKVQKAHKAARASLNAGKAKPTPKSTARSLKIAAAEAAAAAIDDGQKLSARTTTKKTPRGKKAGKGTTKTPRHKKDG